MITSLGACRRIFLHRGVCDMRRSFDRLAGMVNEELRGDPISGDVYVFLNGRRNMLKCLYWDSDGYVIWYKRLERGKFIMPSGKQTLMDRSSWQNLLEGVEVKVIRRQPRYRIPDGKR